MTNINNIKARVLERMEHAMAQGAERIDMQEMEALADIYKDLTGSEEACAKADYYQTVADSMPEPSYGYTPEDMATGMGYVPEWGMYGNGMQPQRSGYRDTMGRYANRQRARRNYGGSYGHTDSIDGIIEEYDAATPEEKEELKRRLRPLLGM